MPDPTARQTAGTTAFRRGDYPRAKREFDRALALLRAADGPDHPQTLRTLSDLGATHAALGDHAASRAAHERVLTARRRILGEAHEDVGVSLHNLASACAALGEVPAAIAHHLHAIAIWRAVLGETHPIIARALTSLAALARRQADPQGAIAYTRQALHIHAQVFPPDHAAIAAALDDLATAQSQAGDERAAQATWQQALSVPGAPVAPLLLKLGISRRRQGDMPGAAGHFAAALRADPAFSAARHHLAATLTRLGRAEEARPHLAAALARSRVFIQPGPAGAPRVLILASATDGNIPLEHLLPEQRLTRIWWFIDHAPNARAEKLPPYDIVFNAIGDPDAAGSADAPVAAFLSICTGPVLNDPARVARTRRDRLPALLQDIDGLTVPQVCRIEGTPAARDIERAGIAPPFLLRPAGAHGGAGILRIEDWDALDPPAAPAWYATSFADCRAPDGHTRKYRVIFVDRVPYPYHLAISPGWLVHYFSAQMRDHAWKLAEEAEFLADPARVLGASAFAAVCEAGRRLDLDYCGMDFGIAGGRVVVFEANATMLVHPEAEGGPLAFKNAYVASIVEAVERKVVLF